MIWLAARALPDSDAAAALPAGERVDPRSVEGMPDTIEES